MRKKLLAGLATGLFLMGMASLSSATPIAGGLSGSYYNDAQFSHPSWNNLQFTQIDPTINFNWGSGSPNSGLLGNDIYSIKWDGQIMADSTGTYNFQTTSDDSSMLYIDGSTVVDNGGNHASRSKYGAIDLTAGLHDIELTYHEWSVWANVVLSWQQNGNYEVIDANHLYNDDGNNPVPEPATMLLFGTGLAGVAAIRIKRQKKR